jgi:hypothetical protein
MAMLWAIANKLPATTFPIIACIAAAKDPNKVSNSVHGKCSALRHGWANEETRLNLPATGPKTPKPSMPKNVGATIGNKMTTMAATPMPTARGSISKRHMAFSTTTFRVVLIGRGQLTS